MKVLAFPSPLRPAPNESPTDPSADAAADPAIDGGIAETTGGTTGAPHAPDRWLRAADGGGPGRYDRITIRAITIAAVLSLFVHLLVLLVPFLSKPDQELKAPADELGPLSVTIASAKPRPPAPTPQPKQEPAIEQPTPRPPKPVPRANPAPRPRPQIAIEHGRAPPFVVPPPVAAPPPTPQVAPPTPQPVAPTPDDFSEALAARQRARRAQNGGAPDDVVESDDQRANRIARANIQAQQRSASPGQDPDQAGGIFDLRHTGLNEAEFVFNGWNHDFRRSVGKTYEVKIGNNPDIRIAVIRQMIQIIRDQKPGDFDWHSHRLNKVVVMSARPADQKELEIFLMKEFYADDPRAR